MSLEPGDFQRLKNVLRSNQLAALKEAKEEGSALMPAYDSPIENFADTFKEVLPPYQNYYGSPEPSYLELGKIFKRYLEETLKDSREERVGIEFGGPGSAFFRGFSKDFFYKTIGVCLKDIRSNKEKEVDSMFRHSVESGNIFDKQLVGRIKKVLNGKTDLIVSRMVGSLYGIKRDPAVLDRLIRGWYKLLNSNGLMFIQFEGLYQISPTTKPKVDAWAEAVRKKYPSIEIQVGKKSLRIHKKDGAPEELPPAKELLAA